MEAMEASDIIGRVVVPQGDQAIKLAPEKKKAVVVAPAATTTAAVMSGSRLRVYRASTTGSKAKKGEGGNNGNGTNHKTKDSKHNSTGTPTPPGRRWVTRELAALDFLLGIPMQQEGPIVQQGWMQSQGYATADQDAATRDFPPVLLHPTGKWWEKWLDTSVTPDPNVNTETSAMDGGPNDKDHNTELELPNQKTPHVMKRATTTSSTATTMQMVPGRRLEGDEATQVQIPIRIDASKTLQRSVARQAAVREWELRVAHGIDTSFSSPQTNPKMLLDGRLFFAADGSYPLGVFSLIRYEPKKEQAARRRQKLEALGGGGTQFFSLPQRDWRGISYRPLFLRQTVDDDKATTTIVTDVDGSVAFDRFATTSIAKKKESGKSLEKNEDSLGLLPTVFDNDDEEDEDVYIPGFLDDPEMVQGKHRNVMIGDRVSGPILSSTIQFVKPSILKADLNQKFRDRFAEWEPPKSQRKYIGAKVVDGIYILMEPNPNNNPGNAAEDTGTVSTTTTAGTDRSSSSLGDSARRARHGSVGSLSSANSGNNNKDKETIRMPPSLTLSKIRSIKTQALRAAVKAKLELGTVALAFVYFERLCLDCRVDKSNRKLSFAACLLLAIKLNESHVGLVTGRPEGMGNDPKNKDKSSETNRIQSLIRPTKKSGTIFSTILGFFTQEWSISLKHLFAAEWGVFAALQFRLHAKPSQVAFHFKILCKSLQYDIPAYLGKIMYSYWQDSLEFEEVQRTKMEERRELKRQLQEERHRRQMQRELDEATAAVGKEAENAVAKAEEGKKVPLKEEGKSIVPKSRSRILPQRRGSGGAPLNQGKRRGVGLNKLLFGKRISSAKDLQELNTNHSSPVPGIETSRGIPMSPSMPVIAGVFDVDSASPSESTSQASPRRRPSKTRKADLDKLSRHDDCAIEV